MLGTVRFLLAYLVVVSHLAGTKYTSHLGVYAVVAFFVVSGFAITTALHEVYQFDGRRFWLNRLLRLLPPYFAVALATLAIIHVMPEEAGQYTPLWNAEHSGMDVLRNLLILPLQSPDLYFRLVPQYWSVSVEIVMYFLLWAFIARRLEFAYLAVVAGAAAHAGLLSIGVHWGVRYFTAPSALLPFALGALLYFLRRDGYLKICTRGTFVAFLVWVGNAFAAGWWIPEEQVYLACYYIATLAAAVFVAGLADIQPKTQLAHADATFGALSYPLFLVQWLVGFAVAVALFPGQWRGWDVVVVATPIMLLVSYGFVAIHERFIEPIRRVVRPAVDEPPARVDDALTPDPARMPAA